MIENTFVILHLNYKNVRKCLTSLRENTPPNFKVILIDQSKVKEDYKDLVDIHVWSKPLGFGKAANLGIRLSDTKYVTVSNDDVEFLNPKWWDGVAETFQRYDTAVAVNPSSPRNLDGGGIPTDHPDNRFWHKDKWTEEEYDLMVKEVGRGHVIDGICTWCTVFDKAKLDLVAGTVPGKAWFDERFFSGAEDYDLNRRAYMTKNPDNKYGGYRMLGTGLSFVWHWWCETKNNLGDILGKDGFQVFSESAKLFKEKWGDGDIYGRRGNMLIPDNIIKDL